MISGAASQSESWRVFVPANPNLNTEWGGMEQQKRWGELSLIALQRCYAWVRQDTQTKSLQSIYHFLAGERFKIGRLLGHNLNYGMQRNSDTMRSPFPATRLRTICQYPEMKARVLEMLPKGHQAVFYYKTFEGKKRVVLTVLYYQKYDAIIVDYPDLSTCKLLMEAANEIWLTLKAESNSLPDADKYYRLGLILWHLALARPLLFGSASVSEFSYHVLTAQLGLPFAAFGCADKVWDVWAMMHPTPEAFAVWFRQIAQDSLKVNPQYQLQPFAGVDHTLEIAEEANRLANTRVSYQDRVRVAFKTMELTDPYGFGLFHHFMMSSITRVSGYALNIRVLMRKAMYATAYDMTPHGEVLFLSACKRAPEAVDPVLFVLNCCSKKNAEQEDILNMTNISHILCGMIFDNSHRWISHEQRRKELLVVLDYLAALITEPAISELVKQFRDKLETYHFIENILFPSQLPAAVGVDVFISLRQALEQYNSYSNEQLMKLIDLPYMHIFFTRLIMEEWLSQRCDGKSFLDNVLLCENKQLMTRVLNCCQHHGDMDQLLDYVIAKQRNHFNVVLKAIFKSSSARLSAFAMEWMVKHVVVHRDNTFGELLLQMKPDDKMMPAFELLIDKGMELSFVSPISDDLKDIIRSFISTSTHHESCRRICQQLSTDDLGRVITDTSVSMSGDALANYCKILNELAQTAPHSPTLFPVKPNVRCVIVDSIMQMTNLHIQHFTYGVIRYFVLHLDFLGKRELLQLRNKLQIDQERTNIWDHCGDIIRTIDMKINAMEEVVGTHLHTSPLN